MSPPSRRALQAHRPRTGRQQRPGRPGRRRHRLRGGRGGLQPLRAPGPGLHGRQPHPRGPLRRATSSPRSSSPRSGRSRSATRADPRPHIGPLINSSQAERGHGLVEQTVAEGATALLRGTTTGNLVAPSVLTDVPDRLAAPAAGDLRPGRAAHPVRRRGGGRPHRQRHPVRTERRRAHRRHRARRRVRPADRHRHVPRQRRHRRTTSRSSRSAARSTRALGRLNGEPMVEAFTTTKWISIQHAAQRLPLLTLSAARPIGPQGSRPL